MTPVNDNDKVTNVSRSTRVTATRRARHRLISLAAVASSHSFGTPGQRLPAAAWLGTLAASCLVTAAVVSHDAARAIASTAKTSAAASVNGVGSRIRPLGIDRDKRAGAAAVSRNQRIDVRGNHLVNGRRTIRLIGVNRSGSEYSCSGPVAGGGSGYAVFQGPVDSRTIHAMLSWRINAVALPLNEACWLGGIGQLDARFSGENYRRAIVGYTNRLNRAGIYVVLRLAGAAPGDNAFGSQANASSSEIPMADADHSIAFWRSIAASFKNNHKILFHIFDEPNAISWDCLLHGCTANDAPGGQERYGSYQTAGTQALVDAIRGQGATQPIIVSGIGFAGDLSQWEQFLPNDPQHALVADLSSFDYSDSTLNAEPVLRRLARRHPTIIGGFGDTNCTSTYSRRVMALADTIGISYLAWTWNTVQDYGGCHNALLDGGDPNDPNRGYYNAQPSGYGRGVRAHYQQLNAHARY